MAKTNPHIIAPRRAGKHYQYTLDMIAARKLGRKTIAICARHGQHDGSKCAASHSLEWPKLA